MKKKLKKQKTKLNKINKSDYESKTLVQGMFVWCVLVFGLILVWWSIFLIIDILILGYPPLFSVKSLIAVSVTTIIVSSLIFVIKKIFFT